MVDAVKWLWLHGVGMYSECSVFSGHQVALVTVHHLASGKHVKHLMMPYLTHSYLSVLLDIAVWIHDTLDNNFGNMIFFTK